MAQPKLSSAAAHAYARSVLELAAEHQQTEAVGQELREIREVVDSNPTFADILANPGVKAEDRIELLNRVFRGKVSPLVMNLLGALNARRRLGMLEQVIDAYDDLLEEQLGKVEADVTVAQRLSDEQLDEVRRRVSEALGKDAVVRQTVDESIIGGLILRVQDRLVDASVRQQLESIRRQMLASRPTAGGKFFASDGAAVAS